MFDGLLLNPRAVDLLQKFIEQPNHAALITGPEGVGLNEITERLSRILLKLKDGNSLENEQNIRILQPKDGTIAVETVRNLQAFFTLKVPGNSTTKRVVMIQGAESLTIEAQNSLLKLLEEPPEGSVLLISTTEPKRLLLTVRSRLSTLLLPAPTKEQIFEWFIGNNYTRAEIERAYLTGDGTPDRMTAILSGDGSDDFAIVRMVLSGKTYDRLLQVDALSKDKQAAQSFIASLAQVASASLERAALQNTNRVEQWQNILAASLTAGSALERNGNTKLVLTDLMLTL